MSSTSAPAAERSAATPGTGLPRRPALDGLRALAVTGVVLYHFDVPWARGGFLGVDVFFVLSGFLITSLLLAELDATGRLGLAGFWAARARRLLPALGVLLVTVLWVLPWAGVRWSRGVAGDAWATAAYVANWRFIDSGQSYVDQGTAPSPLLHTWSLAIEEQWYVVLPLLVAVAAGLLARRRLRVALAVGLATAVVGSAVDAWLLHPAGADVDRVYYGTDTRLQALALGALVATVYGPRLWAGAGPSRSSDPDVAGPRRWPDAAVLAGLAGLLALAAWARPQSDGLYRGGLLVVAAGAALVVAGLTAAGPQPRGLARAFALRPVVALGAISYGVYLWHWPVALVVTEQRLGAGGVALFATRVAVTVAVATASYLLVERPVRRRLRRRTARRPLAWLPATTVATALVVAALVWPVAPAAVAPDSLAALAQVAAQATRSATPAPAGSPTGSAAGSPLPTAGTGMKTVVLVGDSQVLSLFAAVQKQPGAGLQLRVATRLGCGVAPYVATARGVQLVPQQPLCGDWARTRESEIAAARADVGLLFAGTWEEYDRWDAGRGVPYTSAQWRAETTAAYGQVLAEMSRHVRRLAVVLDHCHGAPSVDLPVTTLYQWGRYAPVVNDPGRIAAQNAALRAAAASMPQVQVIDPGQLLCAKGFSRRLDGVTLRTDGVHWSAAGARLVWSWMRPRLPLG